MSCLHPVVGDRRKTRPWRGDGASDFSSEEPSFDRISRGPPTSQLLFGIFSLPSPSSILACFQAEYFDKILVQCSHKHIHITATTPKHFLLQGAVQMMSVEGLNHFSPEEHAVL